MWVVRWRRPASSLADHLKRTTGEWDSTRDRETRAETQRRGAASASEEAVVASSRLDAFRKMAEKDPTNALAQYGLANELVKAGEYEEARATLEAYLAAHDDEGAAYRLLGQACERLGLVDEAKDTYRRGV